MYYSLDFLVKEILKRADENVVGVFGAAPAECVSVAELAESIIPEVARNVVDAAPISELTESLHFDAIPEMNPDGSGYILLPSDFRRLRSFMMSDWERPVETPISSDSPLYMMQRSRHPGLRGNPSRPLTAVVERDGFLTLEFFSTFAENPRIVSSRYIPDPTPDPLHRIWLPRTLLPLLINQAAKILKL